MLDVIQKKLKEERNKNPEERTQKQHYYCIVMNTQRNIANCLSPKKIR